MQRHNYTFGVKLLLFFVALQFSSFSQVKYPNDSSFISKLSERDRTNLGSFSYSKIDTTIDNLHNYYPRSTNGNIGLPSAPLYINFQTKALGFNMYNPPYESDLVKSEDLLYFQTKGPYASLTGIGGTKQEQMFKLLFSTTFKNKLNLTLAFNRYSGLGFFKRQQSFVNNFYTTSNYTSKTGRLGYYAYFNFNKVKHSENGGIADDSLFLADVTINKGLLPVQLKAGRREVRYSNISLNPWFRLNRLEDSSRVLSHFVDYKIDFSGNFTKYTDDSLRSVSFYNTFYLDTIATSDSTHWRTISNAMNYTLKINPINTQIKIGVKNEYNQVYQYLDSTFINNSVNAGVFFSEKNYVGFVKGSYLFNGPNSGDYSIDIGNAYTKTFKWLKYKNGRDLPVVVKLNANVEKRHPDYFYNTWYSNHYIWKNSFAPTEKTQALFIIATADDRFDAGVIFQSTKNLIYMNELAVPEQTSLTIQNLAFFIHKDILLFKHLGVGVRYNYQSSSYPVIVSVPNQIVTGSLYFQGNIKNAMQIQIGFSAQYFSEFYGYAYQPATNMYYVQTTEKTGGYPFVDFFLNARIKPVKFFVKVDHLTQGMLGGNYYLTPHYLQNDRALKFGINWLFFD